jgi:hypothetical protein
LILLVVVLLLLLSGWHFGGDDVEPKKNEDAPEAIGAPPLSTTAEKDKK